MMDVDGRIEARKARWRCFLEPGAPQQQMILMRHDAGLPQRPLPHPDKVEARIEWAWQKYQAQRRDAAWLDDDTVPCLEPYTGTEIFAAAFGCPVHRPDDTNPFARPRIHDASEVAGLAVPDLAAAPLAEVFAIADELRCRAGPQAVMRLPDIQSPMDIAALIWDKGSFYVAMLEAPEAVRELAAKVRQLLTGFLDEWFARYGSDYVAHYPDYYMPGGVTLSEDEIGAVGPELFRELFLPELAELSRRYGGLGMHCCADARQHWEAWDDIPDLRLLNLVHKPPTVAAAYDHFAARVPQMHNWCGDGAPQTWSYPAGSRVVVSVNAESDEAARRLAGELRRDP